MLEVLQQPISQKSALFFLILHLHDIYISCFLFHQFHPRFNDTKQCNVYIRGLCVHPACTMNGFHIYSVWYSFANLFLGRSMWISLHFAEKNVNWVITTLSITSGILCRRYEWSSFLLPNIEYCSNLPPSC